MNAEQCRAAEQGRAEQGLEPCVDIIVVVNAY